MKISLARWCHQFFGPMWSLEDHCKVAKDIGADGIELVPSEEWDTLAKHGLTCPLALVNYGEGGPEPFAIGWNNPDHHERVGTETKRLIRAAQESGGLCTSVIAFSGMRTEQADSRSRSNCAKGLFSTGTIAAAEEAGINLSFEPLNSLIGEPMRGHPGYDADRLEYARDLTGGVQSERFGILFDVYHRQVMEGNIAAALRGHAGLINHVHVAGIGPVVPRGEMNVGPQEVDWYGIGALLRQHVPSCWVGIEYIPTDGRDYVGDLRAAVAMLRG